MNPPDLLLGLAQDVIEEGIDLDEDALFDLPVIYCAAKAGYASENQPENGGLPDNEDLRTVVRGHHQEHSGSEYEEGAPLQAHVANIDSSDFLGRLGLVRIYNGTLERVRPTGCPVWTVPLKTSVFPNCCVRRALSVLRSIPQALATSSQSQV